MLHRLSTTMKTTYPNVCKTSREITSTSRNLSHEWYSTTVANSSYQLLTIAAQALSSALYDLPQGGRHALRACLVEWQNGRLPSQHLLAFVRAIAWQSPALFHLRPDGGVKTAAGHLPAEGTFELLSPEEMLVSACMIAALQTASKGGRLRTSDKRQGAVDAQNP